MPVITNAGEYLITQQQQAGQPLIIDQMILANITGLDSNATPSRAEGMPAPADVKIIKPITKDGLLNSNTVVYSTVFPSTDGTFDFNWMGLYSSAHDVVVGIAYVPLQTKIKTVGTDIGNVITKNFAIEFNAAADITGINISAESWQIDYTARLMSMDKHQRDLVKNIYGRSTFLNDAFKVKHNTGKYYLSAGKAILGGINCELETDLEVVPGTLPATIWLDVYQETSMVGVLNKYDVVVNDGTVLPDYNAGSVEHTLVKLGVVNSSVDIVDGRSLVKRSLELTTKNNDPKNVAELRKYRPEYAGQKLYIDGHTLPGIGGGTFIHDPDDSISDDDNGVVIVNEWGDRFKRNTKGPVQLVDYGADHTGVSDASDAINAAHNSGRPVQDDICGTYLCLSTVRFKNSMKGNITDTKKTTFVKGAGALIVHYPQRRVYTGYVVDANGEPTAVDAFYDASSTFAGGMKYSFMSNVATRGMTQRAFNLNQPLFGATLIDCRVAANAGDGSNDNVTAFYTTIEDAEGIGTSVAATNAAFSLITPNVYNRQNAANDVTFLHADYCRGVSVVGAEVAAARILKSTQGDINIQGAFEYINAHSTIFNSVITIGGGTNIQTFRLGTAEWVGDTGVGSGRHIFRADSDSVVTVGDISFFNQLGTTSGLSGRVGLISCQSGFTGRAKTSGVNEYDMGGGGFDPAIKVEGGSGEVSTRTMIGNESFIQSFSRDLLTASGILPLYVDGSSTNVKKYVRNSTEIREMLVYTGGDTTVSALEVRVAAFDNLGGAIGSPRVVVTIPAGTVSGSKFMSIEPNRTVPDGGYYEVSVKPLSATVGSNTSIAVEVRVNT